MYIIELPPSQPIIPAAPEVNAFDKINSKNTTK